MPGEIDRVFISHSTSDRYFVNLLVALLEYHGVSVWDSQRLKGGAAFGKAISEAIREINTLIVVVTKKSVESEWVKKEVVLFRHSHPDRTPIPLMVEKVSPVDLPEDLADFNWIDFTQDMLTGFRKLIGDLGREFLPSSQIAERRRREAERRRASRRSFVDRRKASLEQRLRTGFWKSFSDVTQLGRLEEVPVTLRLRGQVLDALQREIRGYVLRDELGVSCDPIDVLVRSVDRVWRNWATAEKVKAVHIIELISNDICDSCSIERLERRQKDRRARSRRESEDDSSKGKNRRAQKALQLQTVASD